MNLTASQEFCLLQGNFDPYTVEDLQDRAELDAICQSLVDMGLLEKRKRERAYRSKNILEPKLRRETYYRPTDAAFPILNELYAAHKKSFGY